MGEQEIKIKETEYFVKKMNFSIAKIEDSIIVSEAKLEVTKAECLHLENGIIHNREALCHPKVYTKNIYKKVEITLKVFKNLAIKLSMYYNMCCSYTEKICKMLKNCQLLQKQMTKANNLYNKSDDLQTEVEKKKENAVIKLNKFLQTNK